MSDRRPIAAVGTSATEAPTVLGLRTPETAVQLPGDLRVPKDVASSHRIRRGFRMRRLLAAADSLAIVLSIAAVAAVGPLTVLAVEPADPLPLIPIAAVLWLIVGSVLGLFHVDERRIDCSVADEVGRLAQATAVWTWAVFLVESIRLEGAQTVGAAIVIWAVSVPAMLIARQFARRYARRKEWYWQSALLVGSPADTWRVRSMLLRHPEYGVRLVGTSEIPKNGERHVIGDLVASVQQAKVDRVIFTGSYGSDLDERTGALRELAEAGVKVDLIPTDAEVFRSDAEVHFAEGIPFLTLPTTDRPRMAAVAKRAMDICIASAALIALAPLFVYCAIRIKLDSRGPVFFRQRRAGLKERPFEMLKFRTMTEDAEHRLDEVAGLAPERVMFKLTDDPRVTKFGAMLRKSSIDELPQLINVLRGDMSLVGPRPLPLNESAQTPDRYRARYRVRPGLTGPWQVLGRSDIPFEEMLKLDYTYVTNWSIGDDVKLLIRTLGAISHGRGAY